MDVLLENGPSDIRYCYHSNIIISSDMRCYYHSFCNIYQVTFNIVTIVPVTYYTKWLWFVSSN